MKFNALAAAAIAFSGLVWSSQSEALTLTVGAGWFEDQIDEANSPSEGSPVTFTLATAGVFSLTDAFVPGDIYFVTGDATGTSTFTTPTIPVPLGLGETQFDGPFFDNSYSHLQISLGAGSYSLTIEGDGTGGLPAHFGIRADLSAVPLPASAPLFGAGLIALGAVGYGLKRKGGATA